MPTRQYPHIIGPFISPSFIKPRYEKRRVNIIADIIDLLPAELATLRPQQPALVSSANGQIQQLLFTLPDELFIDTSQQARLSAQTVKSLLAALRSQVELVFVIHDEMETPLNAWLDELGLQNHAKVIKQVSHFEIWAEDSFAVCRDTADNRRYLIEPNSLIGEPNSLIANWIAREQQLTFLHNLVRPPVALNFEGGNMLVGDNFWLIGIDSLRKSLRYLPAGSTVTDSIEAFRATLDNQRRLIPIGSRLAVPGFLEKQLARPCADCATGWTEFLYRGNALQTAQPIFHIDMFLTLAGRDAVGKYRILVGDPRMAADLLNFPLPAHAMAEIFDDIASQLEATGNFHVIRNPLPLIYAVDEIAKQKFWYFASANNALVEITNSGQKHVWLPSYGIDNGLNRWTRLQRTDQKNQEIWANLGFEVHPLGDFNPFALQLGAAHCIKKYLARA